MTDTNLTTMADTNAATGGATPLESVAAQTRRMLRENGFTLTDLVEDGPGNSQLTFWQGLKGRFMLQAFRTANRVAIYCELDSGEKTFQL